MRNQRGITLIALVITIIVLLILAGVSIAMLTGDNGILSKAREAQTGTVKSSNEEILKLAISDVITEHYANSGSGELTITKTDLENAIKAASSDYTVVSSAPAANGEVQVTDNTDSTSTLDVTFYGDTITYKVAVGSGKITK